MSPAQIAFVLVERQRQPKRKGTASDFLNMFGGTPGVRGARAGSVPTSETALAEARRRAFREAGAEID